MTSMNRFGVNHVIYSGDPSIWRLIGRRGKPKTQNMEVPVITPRS